ncbi:MAG: hypothetical protein KDJ40_21290 [Hyphomicrobiales bacterium]|nr:hypothetical protein [Hyphomicrobiales bacterium]
MRIISNVSIAPRCWGRVDTIFARRNRHFRTQSRGRKKRAFKFWLIPLDDPGVVSRGKNANMSLVSLEPQLNGDLLGRL